jgi:hypothetical protein
MPWTTKLARQLILDDGTELVTFKDAVEALDQRLHPHDGAHCN